MISTFGLGVLLISQAVTAIDVADNTATETSEVAYEEIMDGRSQEAVGQLRALLAANPDDPAILINLGAAYMSVGNLTLARASYKAAIESDERYDLELADGTWTDSRHAARLALKELESRAIAMR